MDLDNTSLRRQLPHGLGDLIYDQAAARTRMEELVLGAFERWGYQRIIPPMFEYYASIATGANASLQEGMYRFFNREGQVLALRADMTVPTARVAATKLYDQPMPLRFCYAGSVFRFEEPQAGRRREFTQAGVELIGADTPEADAEVLGVAIAALQNMGMSQFKITLGQVSFLKAILDSVGLAASDYALLEQVIGRRNQIELDATIASLGLTGETARAVTSLPQLYGDRTVLTQAHALATNDTAKQAISRLERVYELLALDGYAQYITLDLAEVRSMAYYTGITFHGYVQGLGFHVCGGGRYDNLLANFGADLPAVGFAIGIERALLVTQPEVHIAPQLVLANDVDGLGRKLALQGRELGLRVELDVLGRSGDALVSYALGRGAERVALAGTSGEMTLYEGPSQRTLTVEQLQKEMATWTN